MSGAPSAGEAGVIERRWLRPLVPLYAAAVMAKNAAYDHHLLKACRLVAPVISIGNLSVGGAGKTPLVIRLAQLLSARGLAVDVLSRGYGRRSGAAEQVRLGTGQAFSAASAGFASELLPTRAFSAGKQADQVVVDPGRYGDEPLLIAQAAGVPVYLGASRYAAGLLAEQRAAEMPRVHLLDDGFQHRRLARVVDLVVLHPGDLSQTLLPAGRLREPLSALRRASVAVLRNEGADPGAGLAWRAWLRERFPLLPVWWMTREIALASHPAPAIAFCGIAHPAEFFRSLERAGASLLARHAFRDHHAYTDADIASLLSSARATGARTLLTTEKDLVRLSPRHCARLGEAATLQAVPLRVTLQDEDAVVDQLLALAGLAE